MYYLLIKLCCIEIFWTKKINLTPENADISCGMLPVITLWWPPFPVNITLKWNYRESRRESRKVEGKNKTKKQHVPIAVYSSSSWFIQLFYWILDIGLAGMATGQTYGPIHSMSTRLKEDPPKGPYALTVESQRFYDSEVKSVGLEVCYHTVVWNMMGNVCTE